MKTYDVVIVGAGAAGLMCAISAAGRGKSVLLVEHAKKVGRKILMSGGGRCNFTNMYTEPENFLSANPHYCKSALSQYTQWDFIELVSQYQIPYHEKTLGQLFCDQSSKDIVNLLMAECQRTGVELQTKAEVSQIETCEGVYNLRVNQSKIACGALVIATGGLSIPSMGPHGYGYQVAENFGIQVLPLSAALVPFVMPAKWQERFIELAGNSVDVVASTPQQSFSEAMLFTHKGLSGPAILQISSYWQPGLPITIDLSPRKDLCQWLVSLRDNSPKIQLKTALSQIYTKRFTQRICQQWFADQVLQRNDGAAVGLAEQPLAEINNNKLAEIAETLHNWQLFPQKTEGYKTAEVTLGGVDTAALSSKTMMVKDSPGLFFIGEVVDVTGHLGGYNFQWAWSSGWVAGQNV